MRLKPGPFGASRGPEQHAVSPPQPCPDPNTITVLPILQLNYFVPSRDPLQWLYTAIPQHVPADHPRTRQRRMQFVSGCDLDPPSR